MKLLYLYVETWPERNITKNNPIEVNFDSGYEFHYDSSANSLSCASGKHELPEGFFSVSSGDRCVESVSVIIGDNGSGKTSIASVLGRLFQRGRHLPEYICIYKQLGQLVLYYHFENRGTPDYSSITGGLIDAEQDPEYGDVIKHDHPFDIIYYSPYFVNNEVWRGEVLAEKVGNVSLPLYDVSTTHLMMDADTSAKNVGCVSAFHVEDLERVLRFVHEYVNGFARHGRRRPSDDFIVNQILPLPQYAQFLVQTMALTEFVLDATNSEAATELRNIVCNDICDNPVWKLASEILVHISRYNIEGGWQSIKEILLGVCRAAKKMSEQTANKNRCWEFYDYVEGIPVKSTSHKARVLKRLLVCMSRLYCKTVDRRAVEGYVLGGLVDITDRQDLDDVLDVNRYVPMLETWIRKLIGVRVRLMEVSIANMSSGEMAYWTLFARLYDVFKMQIKMNDKRDILLFLDEAETTLHPEWQRHLVRNVIWFLEKYVNEQVRDGEKKRHVHVIFATHSPMILSDIPKGNVVALTKDRMSPNGALIQSREQQKDLHEGLSDTFGADTFDLYQRPFSLSEGTIAVFAQEKIDRALKEVATVVREKLKNESVTRKISDETRHTLTLVGDCVVRNWFKDLEEGGLV